MLAAADPAACKIMADQNDTDLFQQAVSSLTTHVSQMVDAQKHDAAIALLEEVNRQLPRRLSADQRDAFRTVLGNCRASQAAADAQRVDKLAPQLLAADEPAKKAAMAELANMGDRAIKPLIAQLRKNLSAAKPNPQFETAVLTAIKQLAPKLEGYDPAAPAAEKSKVLDKWSGKPAGDSE